jgi:endoglucanase
MGRKDTFMTNVQPLQTADSAPTPYALHGKLSVSGRDLVDANGQKVQLYGMSTHGIAWYPQFVSMKTFLTLRDEWHTNCVRLAMYTAEAEGYCTDGEPAMLKDLVKKGVSYATELGMYVIIDWHILREGSPLVYQEEALAFFDEMSSLYAKQDNVLYEICNEPNTNCDWADVSAYANRVIPVIRKNKPNAVILAGTTTWSQDVDLAAAAPLPYENIMYVLHFYAGTHKDALREKATTCLEGGLPIFISEFGTCDASGNGAIDYEQSGLWKELIDKYGLSYMCWNLANCPETSSVIAPDCRKVGHWLTEDLTDQGRLIREWFLGQG